MIYGQASRYLVIVLLASLFGAAYFASLKSSIDAVCDGRRPRAYIHAMFVARFACAAVFMYAMLRYCRGTIEICVMLASFMLTRWLMVRWLGGMPAEGKSR
ncbi:MAG: hypothetical protein LBI17_04180 [Rickettsiales bacterium]|jgi:hypothetical protein|nr:hypothetical protein [Rickettsiales bacterium]